MNERGTSGDEERTLSGHDELFFTVQNRFTDSQAVHPQDKRWSVTTSFSTPCFMFHFPFVFGGAVKENII